LRLKNRAILGLLLGVLLFCSGCETCKGIGAGVARMGEGVSKDMSLAGSSLTRFDDWFKENCW